ncbi:hypothetical protein U9M48_022886 [Paspalum notatum var. saurae]|uniref:TF-B3 domain-containing protein n=1 Tax=Paspalum notatum var. saurae TaxID=547442 RepID=A0AAQ3TLW4_PASNO
MIGAVPHPLRRKSLKSRDSAKTSNNGEEAKKMRDRVTEVKNRKTSVAASLEKGKKNERLNNAHDEEQAMWNGDWRAKNSGLPARLSEKEWKKEKQNKFNSKKKMMADGNNEKKMQIGKEVNNNGKLNKTHQEKMQAVDSKERKILSAHSRVKSGEVPTAFFGKEKKGKMPNKTNIEELQSDEDEEERNCGSKVKNGKQEKRPNNTSSAKEPAPITPAVKKRMRPSESMEMKMQHDEQKRRNVASDTSKEKKMDTSSGSNYKKRKREEPHTLNEKEKRTCSHASDIKIRDGRVKEKNISGGVKEKNRQAPFAFFKLLFDNFEEFLIIPPIVAPRLKNLVNQHVLLKDSEGRHSQVTLSVVGGHLAFHQGWNIFVSIHLIKYGELLLFEYVTTKTFSVRVFGNDSCERLHFTVENKSNSLRKKQTRSSNMSPDDLVFVGNSGNIDYVSGEYRSSKVPVNTKKDPKRVECEVWSVPGAQDRNGNLIDPQCKSKGTSLCRKEKTVILILDSESSAHENGDTVKLTTSDADSDTQHVAVNTNKDPQRAHSGIGNGSSVVLDDKNGSFPPMCSKEKTISGIIVTDAASLTHENDDGAGNELELHDSDKDLGMKLEINSIPSDSITAAVKCHNDIKMNIGQKNCLKYEAPGGFRCLEKWNKGVVNSGAALDATMLIEPKNPQETDSILVDGCGSTELYPVDEYFCSEGNHECVQPVFTMPIKEPSSADRVNKSGHGGTEIDHSIDEKGGGDSVQLETKGGQLESLGNIVNSQKNNNPPCLNPIVLVNCGALGLNPPGSEGTCGFVESRFTVPTEKSMSPDGVSKCGSSRIEIEHTVNGEGTAAQIEKNMDQVEPVGNSVCSQISNVVEQANHVVAHESEHCFPKQEGVMPMKCAVPESLLPIKDRTLELDDHSPLKINLELCAADTNRKWLELPKSLSGAVRQKRNDRNAVLLKDPMKRSWPVLYYENPIFAGFTAGWKHFVAANNLQTGDVCELIKEPDEDEVVYSVQIRRRQ